MKKVLLGAVAAMLVLAAPASAAEISGGTTTLKLDSGTAKALTGAGVSVAPIKPAKAGKRGIAFKITGGEADPASLAGTINHSGGLRFKAGSTAVRLTKFRVKVGKRSSLSALLGGKRVTILSLSTKKAKASRPGGFNTTVSGVRATLTRGAARALNRAFGVSLFRKGTKIGTAKVAAKFAETDLARGTTTLALDPGTASALQSLGVQASVIAPGRATAGGLAFPFSGKNTLNLKTLAGTIDHHGGIALTKGSTRVELKDFRIRIDAKPDLSAEINGGALTEIVDLDVSGLTKSVSGRTITLGGVKAAINAAAAAALNQAFGTTAFKAGTALGTATVVATGK